MENNQDLPLDLHFVKMLKYLCLNFTLSKYSKASLSSSLFKSKTIAFIKTDSYGFEKKTNYMSWRSKKLLCIKVKQVYKNAFKQKENQKVQLGVSWY